MQRLLESGVVDSAELIARHRGRDMQQQLPRHLLTGDTGDTPSLAHTREDCAKHWVSATRGGATPLTSAIPLVGAGVGGVGVARGESIRMTQAWADIRMTQASQPTHGAQHAET